jgi:hypothetical protein
MDGWYNLAEKSWSILAENRWYILAEKPWYILAENKWCIYVRKLTIAAQTRSWRRDLIAGRCCGWYGW